MEVLGVALQHTGQIAVVPLVVDDLNAYRAQDIVGVHQVQQHLGRRVCRIWMDARSKGKRRIGLPHVNVRIDEGDGRGLRNRMGASAAAAVAAAEVAMNWRRFNMG